MPIYEYQASGSSHCTMCKNRFELRQGMTEEPIRRCPQCGAEVTRLFSRSFICMKEPLTLEQTFDTHTAEEADDLGLEGGFAEDQIWE